tara:strand:- start:62 stop:277 length:216 start_codon:yes stop_codon:yes gene_type:complete
MSEPIETGGPACPMRGCDGMTLRDYFAAKAMAAMMTGDSYAQDWTDAKVAEWSYNAADAMIAERKSKEGQS